MFNANNNVILQRFPHVAGVIEQYKAVQSQSSSLSVEVAEAKTGDLTMQITVEGSHRPVSIHSKYNPVDRKSVV